jgi:hypothetical protein
MSNYKLIEVTKAIVNNSPKESQSIYDKDTLDEAIIAMHNDFGVEVKQDATLGVYCVVINNETGAKEGNVQWGEYVKDRVYTHNNNSEDNISAYDSEKLAIGNYNTKLASQRNNAQVNHAVTIRLDGKGDFADADVWNRATN